MKRTFFLWLMVFHSFLLQAAPLSREVLLQFAGAFIQNNFPRSVHYSVSEVFALDMNVNQPIYAINLSPEGWLLVSSDDNLTPVLGFSFNGHFEKNYAYYSNINAWIRGYKDEIQAVEADKSLKRNRLWDAGVNALSEKSAHSLTVEPFIPVIWDQGAGWNKFCPADAAGPGGHAYSGCVGVAMAQAMSVYKFPSKGKSSFSYNHPDYGSIMVRFDAEPEYSWNLMSVDSPDDYNARLLYHTAVSVRMDFGPEGSGSMTSRIPGALINNFRFYKGITRVAKYEDDAAWVQLLISELAAGRPVIYSGDADDDEPGHCFNLDGVINEKYFHFNWGWAGRYNGYFTIDRLNPGSYDFFAHHEAVIHIRPPVYQPTNLELTKQSIKEGMPAGTLVGRLKVNDEADDNKYTFAVKKDSIGNEDYPAEEFYMSGDSLMAGKEFLYNETNSFFIYIEVTDQYNHVYREKFSVSVLQNSILSGITNNEIPPFGIYPNPSQGQMFIKNSDSDNLLIQLVNTWGIEVYYARVPGGQPVVTVNCDIPGAYILRITSSSGNSVTKKVIID